MALKLSQINLTELQTFVEKLIHKTTLNDLLDTSLDASRGDTICFSGSPVGWRNTPLHIPIYTEDGLRFVAGSPPTKELLAVDETVARRNTRNRFTLPVSGKSNAAVVFASGAPGFIFNEVGADENELVYRFFAAGGDLSFDVRSDDNRVSKNWLFVEREGMTIKRITLSANEVLVNDEPVVTKAEYDALLERVEALEKKLS